MIQIYAMPYSKALALFCGWLVTDEMNHKLTQEIALEELKAAVVSLSCGKALGGMMVSL
jgi:hypothetical protein